MTALADKIRRDPFYRKTLTHYGSEEAVIKAGFFDDGLAPGVLDALSDPRWLTTPLYKVRQAHGKSVRPLVLFSTGGFAPVHEGHLQMMEAARAKMTRDGYDVVGGFLAPAHDSYVLHKGHGAERFPIHVRLESLQKAVLASDWLEVDPWMALYTPGDLNFTDVYRRLQSYISRHIPSNRPVEVAYVFGADNALFARSFIGEGLCVCVSRPGHAEKLAALTGDAKLMSTGRVRLAESDVDLSSRQIRMGEVVFAKMTETEELLSDGDRSQAHTLFMRDDLDWAIEPWTKGLAPSTVSAAKQAFVGGLKRIFRGAFAGAAVLPPGEDIEIIEVPSAEQVRWMDAHLADKPFINMDCVTGGRGYPANISRLFHLCDHQYFSLGIIHRPDTGDALENLPAGDYTLVDDDIATGGSMRALEALLPPGVRVTGRVSLLKKWFIENRATETYNPTNILDMRDFLVGARMAGLVVESFDGRQGRVPYLAPYVSLNSRCSVPEEREKSICSQLFALNIEFFEALGAPLRVQDADPSFRRLMLAMGFDADMPLRDLCAWHRERLLYSL